MRYLIFIEKAQHNYAAYSPDVPGCVATSKTIEEVKQQYLEALQFHLEGLAKDNEAIVLPSSQVEYVELSVKPILD